MRSRYKNSDCARDLQKKKESFLFQNARRPLATRSDADGGDHAPWRTTWASRWLWRQPSARPTRRQFFACNSRLWLLCGARVYGGARALAPRQRLFARVVGKLPLPAASTHALSPTLLARSAHASFYENTMSVCPLERTTRSTLEHCTALRMLEPESHESDRPTRPAIGTQILPRTS